MKRLYNEYGAAGFDDVQVRHIDMLMTAAFQTVWDEVVVADNVCPRDAESFCHSVLSALFAENILRRAINTKRSERTTSNKTKVTCSPVKSAYPGGVCPDCGEDIPQYAPEGYMCFNCGHACYSEDKTENK